MAMKPLPRLILIVAAVGAVFYGVMLAGERGLFSMQKEIGPSVYTPSANASEPVTPAAPAPVAAAQPAPAPAPVQAQPAPAAPDPMAPVAVVAPGPDAGLNKLLSAGSKK